MRTPGPYRRTGAVFCGAGALLFLLGCSVEQEGSRLTERQRDSVLAEKNATVRGALAAQDSSAARARGGMDAVLDAQTESPTPH